MKSRSTICNTNTAPTSFMLDVPGIRNGETVAGAEVES